MAVVINEFELAPAAGQPEGGGLGEAGGAGETGSAAAAPSKPQAPVQEAERIMRRQAERALRVWAH
jgi:hypothetical protein